MSFFKILNCSYTTNQSTGSHFHTEYELIFVIFGDIKLISDRSEYDLSAEDFFLINTGHNHSWYSDQPFLLGSIMINPDTLSTYFDNTPVLFDCCSKKIPPVKADQIRQIIKQLLSYDRASDGQGRILFNKLGYQLLYLLTTDYQAKNDDPIWNIPSKGLDKRTYDILRYVNQNYRHNISLAALAENLNLSTPYLSKFFKNRFGMTFIAYLQKIRLEHAKEEIISTQKPLTHIALDNGFPNSTSFINKFKLEYSQTPSEYRKSAKKISPPNEQAESFKHTDSSSEEINSMVSAYLASQNITSPSVVASEENISVYRNSRSVRTTLTFKKPWIKILNIGNSISLLRYDVREQVRFFKEELNFEYIYINNLFHDSMKIHSESPNSKFNFSEIRKVLDFIISLGMHPYIELESQEVSTPKHTDTHLIEASVHTQLEYFSKNFELLDSFISFLIKRYGLSELSQWYITLERSTAINNTVREKDYFDYFSNIYSVIKSRIPGIKIGGPGFTIDFRESTIEKFLTNWTAHGCTPDFINLYVFPYIMDLSLLRTGKNIASSDKSFLSNVLSGVNHCLHRTGLEDREIHVTLWNSSILTRNVLHDGPFKSAYIISTMIECWNKCSMLGYWNATDLSSLDADSENPLFGGSGLISQNNIKKPSFYAFSFLNSLLPYHLTSSKHAIITTDDKGGFAICCHNYKHFNHLYYSQKEEKIKIEEQSSLFEDMDPVSLKITINDLSDGEFLIKRRFVSETAGNIQNAWLHLCKISELSPGELSYLKSQAEPGLFYERKRSENGIIILEETLSPQEIRLIVIEKITD